MFGGCGTIATIGQNKDFPVQAYSGSQGELRSGWAFSHVFLDVPLTVAADTIVLPYTVAATVVNLWMPPNRRKNAGITGDSVATTQPLRD